MSITDFIQKMETVNTKMEDAIRKLKVIKNMEAKVDNQMRVIFNSLGESKEIFNEESSKINRYAKKTQKNMDQLNEISDVIICNLEYIHNHVSEIKGVCSQHNLHDTFKEVRMIEGKVPALNSKLIDWQFEATCIQCKVERIVESVNKLVSIIN